MLANETLVLILMRATLSRPRRRSASFVSSPSRRETAIRNSAPASVRTIRRDSRPDADRTLLPVAVAVGRCSGLVGDVRPLGEHGAQVDLGFTVVMRLPMVFSVGVARGFGDKDIDGRTEWMASLKIL